MLKRFFTSFSGIFCNLFTTNVICRYKRHIVVITMVSLFACCAIVLYPGLNKPSLPSLGQTQLKFFYSGLELGKFGVEEKLNFCISGPINGDGVKPLNLGKEFISKGGSSNIKCYSFLMSSSNDTVQQSSHQNGEDDEIYFFYCLYFVTLFSCLFWFFIVPFLYNAKLEQRQINCNSG